MTTEKKPIQASALVKRKGNRVQDRLPRDLKDEVRDAMIQEARSLKPGQRLRPTRDAIVALQYRGLAKLAPYVLDRVKQALLDQNDPLHQMAVEKLMERVSPQQFWKALGEQEFQRESDGGSGRPSIVLNVTPAVASAVTINPPGPVVDEQ